MAPKVRFQGPSWDHPFGTDEYGRDILSRLIYGARISLQVGVISVGISLVVGAALGLIAGFYGRWVDMILSRVMDILFAFPAILLGDVPVLGGEQREGRIARGTEDASEQVQAGDRTLPALAHNDNAVRRFIALVDECYDRGVPLYIEADVPLEQLYEQGYLAFPFRRTLSRLREMQLERFGR